MYSQLKLMRIFEIIWLTSFIFPKDKPETMEAEEMLQLFIGRV
jgi:hypothetical protein